MGVKLIARITVLLVVLTAVALGYQNCGKTTGSPFALGTGGLNSTGTIINTVIQPAAVTGGAFHSCAITGAGGVKCWGQGVSGQLGYGGTSQALSAVAVYPPLPYAAVKVVASDTNTCALLANNTVYCWGDNTYGQIGNGQVATSPLLNPTLATALGSQIYDIALSSGTLCGVNHTGIVLCVGSGGYGELGTGSSVASTGTAVAVPSITNAVKITGSYEHFCAVTSTNVVYCWGSNFTIGNGTVAQSPVAPTMASGVAAGVTQIATGISNTCAVTTASGIMQCFGLNNYGQLGDGNTSPTTTPVTVAGGQYAGPFTTAAVGSDAAAAGSTAATNTACGLGTNGSVYCWGAWGVNGSNVPNNQTTPVGVLSGVGALGAGLNQFCAVLSGYTAVKCWGDNSQGELGNNSTTSSLTSPVQVVNYP